MLATCWAALTAMRLFSSSRRIGWNGCRAANLSDGILLWLSTPALSLDSDLVPKKSIIRFHDKSSSSRPIFEVAVSSFCVGSAPFLGAA